MAAKDDKLIEYIRNEKSRSQMTVRQHYEPDWDEAIECYMNHRTTDMPPGAEWVRDDQIAEGFRTVETLVPQHVLGTYQNDRWFTVEAPTVAGETYQKMVHALLTVAHNKAKYMLRSIPEIRMVSILGHGFQKTYYAVEVGKKKVRRKNLVLNAFGEPIQREEVIEEEVLVHDGPWVEWPDLKTVWKSVETDRFGRHLWYLHSTDTTLDLLEYEDNEFDEWGGLYKNLKKLREVVSMRPSGNHSGTFDSLSHYGHGAGDPFDFQSIEEMISGIGRSAKRGTGAVTKWEWCGWVPETVYKYPDDEGQWRLIEIANGEVLIRDDVIPTWDGRPFYDEMASFQVGKEPYGRGFLRWIYPEIEQMSLLRNLRLAGTFAELFPQWVANADVDWESEEFARMPGGVWWVHAGQQGTNLNSMIQQVQRQPILPNAYTETALLEDHILKTSGATEPFQGSFAPGGSHRTLGEFQGTVALGASRHRLQIVLNDLQGKLPFLQRAFHEYQVNQPEIIVELANEHDVRGEVPFDLLEEDVDIRVDSGAFGQLDSAKLNNLVSLLGAFAQSPQFAMAMKPENIIRDAFFYAGFPRASRYTRTEDEMAQMAAQEQQQRLLEAALGGNPDSAMESGR